LLEWTTAPLVDQLDIAGDLELEIHATATAIDTAWIVTLQDVAPDGSTVDVTAGYLRASLRGIDDERSVPGAPVLPCRTSEAVAIDEPTVYRVPLVANARRFDVGHSLRILVAGDDQDTSVPAIMGFRHASVGTSSLNTIYSTSRLLLPVT
jgi:predicted acyl esterase